MKTFLQILFFSCFFKGSAQDLCAKIDSMKIFHIPVNISTILSLDDYDIKHFDKKYLKNSFIKDTVLINEFCEFFMNLQFDDTKSRNSLDARIVIELNLNSRLSHTIVIDRYGNMMLNNYAVKRNNMFIDWINLNFLNNNNVGF